MRGSELGDREMAMPWREGTLSTERRNEEKKRGAEFAKEEPLSDHGTGGQKIHKRATGVSLFVCCLFCFVVFQTAFGTQTQVLEGCDFLRSRAVASWGREKWPQGT